MSPQKTETKNLKLKDMRIGFGSDYHVLQAGLPLFLGGVKIDAPFGCRAHSDGDVLLHAICDALLGALALGDIGEHFPDSDIQYKNIRSLILLEKCHKKITQQNYRVVNVDSMLMLETPKIKSYKNAMRSEIARVLDVPMDAISIKATTAEGLGFVGRKEGVTAQATVLLRPL